MMQHDARQCKMIEGGARQCVSFFMILHRTPPHLQEDQMPTPFMRSAALKTPEKAKAKARPSSLAKTPGNVASF